MTQAITLPIAFLCLNIEGIANLCGFRLNGKMS
jgi:hypothetical protein